MGELTWLTNQYIACNYKSLDTILFSLIKCSFVRLYTLILWRMLHFHTFPSLEECENSYRNQHLNIKDKYFKVIFPTDFLKDESSKGNQTFMLIHNRIYFLPWVSNWPQTPRLSFYPLSQLKGTYLNILELVLGGTFCHRYSVFILWTCLSDKAR